MEDRNREFDAHQGVWDRGPGEHPYPGYEEDLKAVWDTGEKDEESFEDYDEVGKGILDAIWAIRVDHHVGGKPVIDVNGFKTSAKDITEQDIDLVDHPQTPVYKIADRRGKTPLELTFRRDTVSFKNPDDQKSQPKVKKYSQLTDEELAIVNEKLEDARMQFFEE